MTHDGHFDVASYALGVLDEYEAALFEDHLIECGRCAVELESFLPLADMLAEVDASAVIAAEESRQQGKLLNGLVGAVKRERRRANSRRLYSLAAAVVIFAMLSIGALFAGGRWLVPGSQPGSTTAHSPTQDPLPNGDGAGVGGPDLTGQRYSGKDPRTGVILDAALAKEDWGTKISFVVSNIQGPRMCRLLAVHTDGTKEPLISWNVTEKGWGTAANPQPLVLEADTATSREKIAYVQVQEVTANGAGNTLVQAPN